MTPEEAKLLGQLIHSKREALSLSARQFANQVHVHPSTIIRLEHGEFMTPKDTTMRRLATALGITQTELATITAHYVVPTDLPELPRYLAAKYPDLSAAAVDELIHRFNELHAISRDVAGWKNANNAAA